MNTKLKSNFIPNKYFVVTGRQKEWLKGDKKVLPVSCTMINVADSFHEVDCDEYGFDKFNKLETIAGSWDFVSHAIKTSAGVAVNLNSIRPKGTIGTGGMVSQGVVNFMKIYSDINAMVVRGSVFKNGAVVLFIDYNHPDLEDFLNYPTSETPWAKRSVYVDENLFNNENYARLQLILRELSIGSIFIAKKEFNKDGERLFSNVCVTGDTLIPTSKGLRRVVDLIGVPFKSIRNSNPENTIPCDIKQDEQVINTLPPGFFPTGLNEVWEVKTEEGYSIQVTKNHKFNMIDGTQKPLFQLVEGDKIKINEFSMDSFDWEGIGNFNEGWLCGYFIGNGTWVNEKSARLPFWPDWSVEQLDEVQLKLNSVLTNRLELHERNDYKAWEGVELGSFFKRWGIFKGKKEINNLILGAGKEFIQGLLQGYFDADCCVTKISNNVRETIQIKSINLEDLKRIQILLSQFNIKSQIWEDHQPKGLRNLPANNGTGKLKFYECQSANRLDICGRLNVESFMKQISLSKIDKIKTYFDNREKYYKKPYKSKDFARVKSVISQGLKETFNCHIEDSEHSFIGNGLSSRQCHEILLKSRATCTLGHINLGLIEDWLDIPAAFEKSMMDLIQLWEIAKEEQRDSGYYLDPDEDPQVGLGLIGLANMLAAHKISYKNFVEAMENIVLYYENEEEFKWEVPEEAMEFAFSIVNGYGIATEIANAKGFNRAFTIAPTVTCAFNQKDYRGYVCAPEISPPVANPETKILRRNSERLNEQGYVDYQFPPDIELCKFDVPWEIYDRLVEVFQILMNDTGLAHSISYNWWFSKPINNKTFKEWFDSELKTIYYRWDESSDVADKTKIGDIQATEEDMFFWQYEETPNCEIRSQSNDDKPCMTCG